MEHVFSLSTKKAEADEYLSSKPACSTEFHDSRGAQRNPASKKTSKHPTNQQNNQTNKLKTVFIT